MKGERRVVVTGLGAVTPVGNTVEDSWKNILAGKSGVAPIHYFDASEFAVRFSASVKQDFDVTEYMSKKDARKMDSFIHYGIAAGLQAFRDSGLEITDEIRVTIAGEACMLLLNRNITECFSALHTILVYPHAYIASGKNIIGGRNILEEEKSVRLGESWQNGEVIMAWDHVKSGGVNFEDGQNVVLHEFSHQLDQASGSANGAPVLKNSSSYKTWGAILSYDYMMLVEKTKEHKKDVMDSYGATNPAEFFAVATETFYEKPKQLRKKHPKLFEELKKYYRINPEEWT